MSSWPALADQVLLANRDLFGESVTYERAAGGAPVALVAIFEDDALLVRTDTGVPVRSGRPAVDVRLADLPEDPVAGDRVTARSVEYTVADIERDGQGGARLWLHLAAT